MISTSDLAEAAVDRRRSQRRTVLVPAWNLVALAAGVGAVALSAGPISDVDVYWHVEVGAYTLHGHGFPQPDPWAFTLPNVHWHSTAWLSELVLAAVQRSVGWSGLVALRLVLSLLVSVALARLLLRGRSGWAGPAVYAVVVLPLVGYVQERPQTASLLFLLWLAGRLDPLLTRGELPRRWSFVAMTWIWACVHGLFVLAPAMLVLVGLAGLLDGGIASRSRFRSLAVTALLSTAVAGLTPMGPRLLLAPLTVGSAARGFISEWGPTTAAVPATWGMFVLAGVLFLAWARSATRVPRSEVLVALALLLFGLAAIRNAGPTSILLAPLTLRRMEATWDTSSQLRVARAPVAALGLLALLASCLSYLQYPALPPARPSRVAAVLAAQPAPLRVLNDYNVSGYLISTAGRRVRLTVDGRADRYGHDFLHRYDEGLNGETDWQAYVRSLRPDVAVLGKDSRLGELLIVRLGWRKVLVDHAYALYAAPTTVLAPA